MPCVGVLSVDEVVPGLVVGDVLNSACSICWIVVMYAEWLFEANSSDRRRMALRLMVFWKGRKVSVVRWLECLDTSENSPT